VGRECRARHRASDILGRAGHGSDGRHWRRVRDGGLNSIMRSSSIRMR
jgi:hypothetical protein